MNAITTVEDMETFAETASGRFLAWTLCDPLHAGVGRVDEGLAEEGERSFCGSSWRGEIYMIDLGPCKTSTAAQWEKSIKYVAGGRLVVYTDGSRDGGDRVSRGWYADGNGAGSVAFGNVTTVWDGEGAGIWLTLRLAPDVDILVLTDSKVSLLAIRKSASSEKGRTRDQVEVVNEVGRCNQLG